MVISLGLGAADKARLNALLITHHRIDVTVQLLDLEHNYLQDLSKKLLGGQVSIDAQADTSTRALTLELLDPNHALHLDTDAPTDGSIHYARMIRVVYSVSNAQQTQQFNIPIFTGPVTKVDRDGVVIAIECQGKETLSMGTVWTSHTFKEGLKKTAVITSILKSMGGERRLNIPDLKLKAGKVVMNFERAAWPMAKSLAGTMGYRLFYDGRGIAQMRKTGTKTAYVFSEKGALLSDPKASYATEGIVNCVLVIGGKPKGAKHKVTYRLVAPRTHSLSPWSMGRWGTPRYLPEVIQDDSIKSVAAARSIARAHLRSALIQSLEVAFDSLPIPYLEEYDLCRVNSTEFSGLFTLTKMTIPLTADGSSSIGYLKRVTPNKRQLRIKGARTKRKVTRR